MYFCSPRKVLYECIAIILQVMLCSAVKMAAGSSAGFESFYQELKQVWIIIEKESIRDTPPPRLYYAQKYPSFLISVVRIAKFFSPRTAHTYYAIAVYGGLYFFFGGGGGDPKLKTQILKK